jgi:hypothetical protein
MSMKNSSDTIGNRTRDLPACSAVPQPMIYSQKLKKISGYDQVSSKIVILTNEQTNQEELGFIDAF